MNSQEIFTPEERDENTKRKRELIKLVASGEAILIVGAGSSRRVGYPDWSCLLKELDDLASGWDDGFKPDEGKRENDPLAYAEEVKSSICKTGNLGRYHALLYKLFKRKTPSFDYFHKRLVSLPFRGILTTNYDTVLEAALGEAALGEVEQASASDNSLLIDDGSAGRVHEFLRAMTDSSLTRRIAHLHGRFDLASSIILSIEDYKRAYGLKLTANQVQRDSEWTLHRKLLWAVLATRRVVFIGFSMNDPYLNEMLETVSADLWAWGQSTHYVIMSISPESAEGSKDKAEKLKSEYGVDTVFYEDSDNSHRGLDHIVAEIFDRCDAESRPPIDVVESRPPIDVVESRPPIDVVESQPPIDEDELDWLERMNQRMERKIDDEN